MKKALSLILFVSAVFSGCEKDLIKTQPEENNSRELTTIVAYLDVSNNTKLSLVDGVKLAWAVGDQIKVGDNKTFTVDSVDAVNPTRAFFKGTAPATAEKYKAYYPTSSYSSTAGRFGLSKTQKYDVDNKVTNVNYMYAETTDYNEIHFHNVCGLLAIDLKGEGTVSNIRVTADQYMAGTLNGMSISEGGALTYTSWYTSTTQTAATYVDLKCGNDATLSMDEARRFYIALPEVDYTNLKLVITTGEGTMVVPATKTASVKKNNIYHIPEITVDIKPLEFDAQIAVVKNTATATSLDFAISVTPTDKNVYYILDIKTPADVGDGDYAFAKEDVAKYSGATLSQLVQNGFAFKGDCTEYTQSGLLQNTDYIAYAYAVDEYFNVSAPIKLSFKTAKGELPECSAQYSDYLGEWVLGEDVITVEELENGKTYKVTGISILTDQFYTIPYVTASFEKGNFVLKEQYTDVTSTSPYGDADFYLSALKQGNPNYPFATKTPSMILYGQYSADKITVYSSYDAFGVSFIVLSGTFANQGMVWSTTATIPTEMKHPEKMPEALLGQWRVTDDNYDRTGWTWTLTQSGLGVKIDNFDPMFAEAGGSDYDAPVFTWDSSAKTLTLPAKTATGYTYGSASIGWVGTNEGIVTDIVLNVDLDNGTLTLANDAYAAYCYTTFSWYDAPLVFHKVASASVMAKTTTAKTGTKVNIASRPYEGGIKRIISSLPGKNVNMKNEISR